MTILTIYHRGVRVLLPVIWITLNAATSGAPLKEPGVDGQELQNSVVAERLKSLRDEFKVQLQKESEAKERAKNESSKLEKLRARLDGIAGRDREALEVLIQEQEEVLGGAVLDEIALSQDLARLEIEIQNSSELLQMSSLQEEINRLSKLVDAGREEVNQLMIQWRQERIRFVKAKSSLKFFREKLNEMMLAAQNEMHLSPSQNDLGKKEGVSVPVGHTKERLQTIQQIYYYSIKESIYSLIDFRKKCIFLYIKDNSLLKKEIDLELLKTKLDMIIKLRNNRKMIK